MVNETEMNEHQRQFYKQKMKAIKEAIQAGDEAKANRHANEILEFFDMK